MLHDETQINSIDQNINFEYDLLDAIHLLEQSWNEIKPETLANCFKKAGFIGDGEDAEINIVHLVQHLPSIFSTKCYSCCPTHGYGHNQKFEG